MNSRPHPALSAYLSRAGIAVSERPDGALVLVFDALYRVYLWPTARGDLVLEHRLLAMPSAVREADDMLELAAGSAALRLVQQRETIALSDDGRQLLLQQRIAADASIDAFELALENFLNAIADWRLILRANHP